MPTGLLAREPAEDDVAALATLVAAHRDAVRGQAKVDQRAVAATVTGTGSWTRRQLLVEDADGRLLGWVAVHDRAAGRTGIELTCAPVRTGETSEQAHRAEQAEQAQEAVDAAAAHLLAWAREAAAGTARLRGLTATQLDAYADEADADQRRRLGSAGYRHVRTWMNMTRGTEDLDAFGEVRDGVVVRRVATHENDLPVAADIQVVHQMLEESFADHFNSYRESFPEFLQRLREDPGHRWDHWWVAEVDGEPGGALVSSVLTPDEHGRAGSYVDYIGVHRRARGRGVAKALLGTVLRDAAERGRNRVNLEVDADSPTGADGLYTSLGWAVTERTESWHADLEVDPEVPEADPEVGPEAGTDG
ncbi:GNAT family N-acetyltransferase [Nocardioides sp. HDW12B]|nr:GNAT family N-acetyltransferase [Nocardioides sp. HDW12B]